jgi:ABC-2 type transport system ATP-binding protein
VADARPNGTGSATALLDVRGARRRVGERQTLAGVDLATRPGELVALLGPNGAGKTTLLRAIAGRVALDAGEIRVGGDPPGSPAARRRTGLVPQSIALYPQLGVRANLEIFGRLAGVAGAALQAAVAEALDWTGLAPRAGDALRELSGGMQRRVNIAAGTLHAPALLLLDEPSVGLDPGARAEVHEVLHRLRARAMGMLLTTHDLDEAAALADRVAIMKDGQVIRLGTPRELVAEVFGDRRELSVRLAAEPGPDARRALAAAGLLPTAAARAWTGAVTDDLEGLGAVRAALQAAGIGLEALQVREAGLHGVFLRLTGQELDP